jgi:hypothetical protein
LFLLFESQLRSLSSKSPDEVAKTLGLPAKQAYEMAENGVDVYSIVPKPGENPEVFISKVAKTSQGNVNAPGGATQVIVPDRSVWSTPEKQGAQEFNVGGPSNRSLGAELSSLNPKTDGKESNGAQDCGTRIGDKTSVAQACVSNQN